MISKIIHWLAVKRGYVFIPKMFWKWHHLSYCDKCGEGNFIGRCDNKVIYKWDNKKKRKTFRYVHAHYKDCKRNKRIAKKLRNWWEKVREKSGDSNYYYKILMKELPAPKTLSIDYYYNESKKR